MQPPRPCVAVALPVAQHPGAVALPNARGVALTLDSGEMRMYPVFLLQITPIITDTFNHLYISIYHFYIYLYSVLLPAISFIVVAHLSPDVPEPWSTKPTHQWLVPVPSARCEGHRAITLRIPRPNQGHPEELVCEDDF